MNHILYMAPVKGITDRIFRQAFSHHFRGIDRAVTPFVDNPRKDMQEKSIIREFPAEENSSMKIIPQILSNDPVEFTFMANFLYDLGYGTVNWNMGCPYPMVVNRGKGAAMLKEPDKVDAFLDRTLKFLKSKISIKLRLGLEEPDELTRLAPVLNRYPIEELIVHARTASDMYKGAVDLDNFKFFLDRTEHTIVYNGDIESINSYREMSVKFPEIVRWMLGRGILTNPFLAGEIKEEKIISDEEMISAVHKFHDELFSEYSKILSGPAHITNRMKAVWFYMSDFFDDSRKINKAIKKTYNEKQYLEVVEKLFRNELTIKKRL